MISTPTGPTGARARLWSALTHVSIAARVWTEPEFDAVHDCWVLTCPFSPIDEVICPFKNQASRFDPGGMTSDSRGSASRRPPSAINYDLLERRGGLLQQRLMPTRSDVVSRHVCLLHMCG